MRSVGSATTDRDRRIGADAARVFELTADAVPEPRSDGTTT